MNRRLRILTWGSLGVAFFSFCLYVIKLGTIEAALMTVLGGVLGWLLWRAFFELGRRSGGVVAYPPVALAKRKGGEDAF